MKLSYTVATSDTRSPSMQAWRGTLDEVLPQLATLGYHGVELMVRDPSELSVAKLRALLVQTRLAVAAVSTGQLRAEDGLQLCCPEQGGRAIAVARVRQVIDFAAEFGAQVNIGSVRGSLPAGREAEAREAAARSFEELLLHATKRNVGLAIEPQNRYVINWINNATQAAEWIERFQSTRFTMIFDLYHWMLEESSWAASLVRYRKHLSHVQFSDNNRLAPGWGQLDFAETIRVLRALGYTGYISVECMQEPSSRAAAQQAAQCLLPFLNQPDNL